MYTILETDLLSQSVMLTQPSDEIWAWNSLRETRRAVLLQDAVMSYSSFPYALRLSPNKLHEYKQFYLQFFAYIFLASSDYGFSQHNPCSRDRLRLLLDGEPKGAFKNICGKFSSEYSVFVFISGITWILFWMVGMKGIRREEREERGGAFPLCLFLRKPNQQIH